MSAQDRVPSIIDLLTKISVFVDSISVDKDEKLKQQKEVAQMALDVLFCMVRPCSSAMGPRCTAEIPREVNIK